MTEINQRDPETVSVSLSGLNTSNYDCAEAQTMVNGIFDLFDSDKSGYLKKTEFMNVTLSLTQFFNRIIVDLGGEKPTLDDTEEVMDMLDKNGDGQISKLEVVALFDAVFKILETLPKKSKIVGSHRQNAFLFTSQ